MYPAFLHTLSFPAGDLGRGLGAAGSIEWDRTGQNTRPVVLATLENGRIRLLVDRPSGERESGIGKRETRNVENGRGAGLR